MSPETWRGGFDHRGRRRPRPSWNGVSVSTTLFDTRSRNDPSPRSGNEDSFSFLNRVESRYWQRVRELLERLYADYPMSAATDVRARFRDRRWPQHVGAWWELYVHGLLRRLGYTVEPHPKLTDSQNRPDFRATGHGDSFLIEARWVRTGLAEPGRGQSTWITSPLERLSHPAFVVAVEILRRGEAQPRVRAVQAGVLAWLDGLDHTVVSRQPPENLPTRSFAAGDWSFELTAVPVKPERRGVRRSGLILLYPGVSGMLDDAAALKRALREKARKYGDPTEPLLLALLDTSGFLDDQDVMNALYGSDTVVITEDGATRSERQPDGFWTSASGWRNTRVSGVLVGRSVMPWNLPRTVPTLWVNPEAPLQAPDTFRVPRMLVRDGRVIPADQHITGASIFGLPAGWPGPEPAFPR